MNIMKNIKNFLPHPIKIILKKMRDKVTSLEILKLYKTKTGNYYMPLFSYQDIIKKDIINDKIGVNLFIILLKNTLRRILLF